MMILKTFFLFTVFFSLNLAAQGKLNLKSTCLKQLSSIPGPSNSKKLDQVCDQINILHGCESTKGNLIYHYDKTGITAQGTRVLVFALFHGDEVPSGAVARHWMERLVDLNPRNTWRIIPVFNPDGLEVKTRYNANKVDLNRNFPTKKWNEEAHYFWKEKAKGDPRKFPGDKPGTEIEIGCATKQVDVFKPDLIVSIHTPYGVLDFDGPGDSSVKDKELPWTRLGHYPGSLGRYMWHERNIPVLTIELKGNDTVENIKYLDELHDNTGSLAIKVTKKRK